jgi:hypothetical protein
VCAAGADADVRCVGAHCFLISALFAAGYGCFGVVWYGVA